MGRHEVGFVENTEKIPLGLKGEGCLFTGRFQINKVPGNFHVSTHSANVQPEHPDMSHVIHELSFGDDYRESYGINSMAGSSHYKGFNSLGGFDKSKVQGKNKIFSWSLLSLILLLPCV